MNVRCPHCGAEGGFPWSAIIARCPRCRGTFQPGRNEARPNDHALDEFSQ